jgi:septal ring factor EnvC (AmiA/AmiB activator)
MVLFLAPVMVCSQGKKEALQKSKKQIEEEIQLTNKLLQETQKNKQSSLNQVMLLKNQIDKRENLITTINDQVSTIDEEIILNAKSLEEMTAQLEKLKAEYAKMAYYVWTHRKTFQPMLFMLSSENFNQAYRRMNYIQQYTKYRKRQVNLIREKQRQIYGKVEELKVNKTDKLSLMSSQQQERDRLNQEQELKNKKLSELKTREKELRSTLKEKEKANRQLQASIQNLINDEIRKANANKNTKKVVKTVKTTTGNKNSPKTTNKTTEPAKVSTTEIALTPDETALSNSFSGNKGRLPWPTEKGVVSSSFGEHPHPVLAGVVVKNNGIDILTHSGARARTVFNGSVSGVIAMPNGAKAVIVRHGDFLTVYSNLSSVFVRTGQKVSTKQDLGVVRTDDQDSRAELHFELWHNKSIQNPALWIAR